MSLILALADITYGIRIKIFSNYIIYQINRSFVMNIIYSLTLIYMGTCEHKQHGREVG